MSESKRMVEINNEWFDLSEITHWWINKFIAGGQEPNYYYLKIIFNDKTGNSISIYIGEKEKRDQVVVFLEELMEKYYTHRFEFKKPKPLKDMDLSSTIPVKPKAKPYLEEIWEDKEEVK